MKSRNVIEIDTDRWLLGFNAVGLDISRFYKYKEGVSCIVLLAHHKNARGGYEDNVEWEGRKCVKQK